MYNSLEFHKKYFIFPKVIYNFLKNNQVLMEDGTVGSFRSYATMETTNELTRTLDLTI